MKRVRSCMDYRILRAFCLEFDDFYYDDSGSPFANDNNIDNLVAPWDDQGGFKAYGKNAKEANLIYNQTLRIQDAGAFAAEIEIIPYKLGEYISKNVDIFMIGMGSGQGCDAQYLFSEDILGYNQGHIPRHAKVYTNLNEDYERIKTKSINAYKNFKSDIVKNIYPDNKHDINMPQEEFEKFLKDKP